MPRSTPPQTELSHPLVDPQELRRALARLNHSTRPHTQRLWAYYQNPLRIAAPAQDQQGSDRPYRQGQEWGLPSRITGLRAGTRIDSTPLPVDGVARKEVVIENDIRWRVDTLVNYLFGKSITLHSTAPHPRRQEEISRLLRLVLAANGGILFLQQMALIGCVHGFVDVLVKLEPAAAAGRNATDLAVTFSAAQDIGEPALDPAAGPSSPASSPVPHDESSAPATHDPSSATGPSHPSPSALQDLQRVARMVRLEIVEPARALPFLSPDNPRLLSAYGQLLDASPASPADPAASSSPPSRRNWWPLRRLRHPDASISPFDPPADSLVEIITPRRWQRLRGETLIDQGANSLGQIPIAHIQNLPLPFQYAGASDVEPLIPLQDELNTRLSDRANRIALQSFKMYVGKNIDGFADAAIAPGKLWTTDNPDAEILSFGGDPSAPSEDAHIADLREALDKASGVSPVAAGAIKNRIGNLTSAAALRITLFALLSKNDRKRTTYGAGLQRICELALAWLDHAGLFHTAPHERQVQIHWPSPLPENQLESLQEADLKLRVGVAPSIVLKELGY